MKFKIISEDFPDGLNVDWPAVPGTGDCVSFKFKGGTSTLHVERVDWACDADGGLIEVKVAITY
ncbi:MAG: hypothetical protein E5Y73_32445 [Mesorhizobium sp.]|uniref:hypothetical protein n=1 Tax=Mesorhizobium sp. TaxID=1871066 RepID=UPI001229AB3F|nr:hypothetical protein [Mesorhizobium sp.]TIL84640.1 MAG: hypothetical protein E5Y73_32445 [Mesorhizobium sp.]